MFVSSLCSFTSFATIKILSDKKQVDLSRVHLHSGLHYCNSFGPIEENGKTSTDFNGLLVRPFGYNEASEGSSVTNSTARTWGAEDQKHEESGI